MLNRFTLGVAASVLVVLASGWALFRDSFSSKKPAYTNLYCPGCEQEMLYDAAKAGKPCPFCVQNGAESPPELVPAIGRGEGRILAYGTSPTGKIAVFLLIFVVTGQVDALLWYWHRQERRRQDDAYKHRVLVCRCPFCRRKVGYRAHQIGHGVTCQRCKTAFVLPGEEAGTDAGQPDSPPQAC